MIVEGSKLGIWFDHAAGLRVSTGTKVTGFEIAAAGGKLYPVDAKIDGTTILLSSPKVDRPAIARYAFKDAVVSQFDQRIAVTGSPFPHRH